MATDLIMSKTELETRLLSLIVNKLGDPSGQMSSKAIELLKQLLKKRPALKIVVIKEVRQIIYKSNIKIRTIFNGIVFLSQIRLFKGIFDKFNLNL
jgi:ribosome biogenesis protein MAK21